MHEFGLGFNNYDITSFVDLLRLIRNVLQHGQENPKSMAALTGIKNPSSEAVFAFFQIHFPFFLLAPKNKLTT